MNPGNVDKTLQAPVTAVLGWTWSFTRSCRNSSRNRCPRWFAGKPALIESTAFRNSSLQGGYFMLAARAVGLDCGPMSGFNADEVNAAFFLRQGEGELRVQPRARRTAACWRVRRGSASTKLHDRLTE